MGECGEFGACRADSPYVDTAVEMGGLWSFKSEAIESISNQYAAMPSLHIGWALWCALILVPRLGPAWARALAVAYPFLTLFAIVVTANHWWIDALGGILVVAIGVGFSHLWEQRKAPYRFGPARIHQYR